MHVWNMPNEPYLSDDERLEVISIRLSGAHIRALRARGISLGPHVRRLVETLLGPYTGAVPWVKRPPQQKAKRNV
jgi:hypothetical protein